jgi:hypothetical protein
LEKKSIIWVVFGNENIFFCFQLIKLTHGAEPGESEYRVRVLTN